MRRILLVAAAALPLLVLAVTTGLGTTTSQAAAPKKAAAIGSPSIEIESHNVSATPITQPPVRGLRETRPFAATSARTICQP